MRQRRQFVIFLTFCALLFATVACDPVTVPEEDDTEPKITWLFQTHNEIIEVDKDDEEVVIDSGARFLKITMSAEDPQGIHRTTMCALFSYYCVKDGIKLGHIAPQCAPSLFETIYPPDEDGTVLTVAGETWDYPLLCPEEGALFSSGEIDLYGEAENFGGQTTKEEFDLRVESILRISP